MTQDYLARLDACESYVPTAEGLQMFSNGNGFYSAERLFQWSYHMPSSLALGSDMEVETAVHVTQKSIQPPSSQPATCSPHTLVTPPFKPQVTQHSEPQPILSDEEVRSLIEEYIRSAPWFGKHEHEPLVGGDGVPACASQLASKGESIYRCFVVPDKSKKNKPMFKCATCEYTSDRLHRVVGHQRVKRNHKPFACQDDGW